MLCRQSGHGRPAKGLSLALVWSLFFVLLQSFSAAHALEYGDKQHFHNGEVCLIQAVADRDDEPGVLPDHGPVPYPSDTATAKRTSATTVPLSSSIRPHQARAPPQTR